MSPSFGYLRECGYAGMVFTSSYSFYDVNRKIQGADHSKRKAHNNHKSYDFLIGFKGGLKFKNRLNLILLPTIKLDYLNILERGYQESGAGAVNLSVRNAHSAFFRSEVTFKLLKQFRIGLLCSSPSIYVGWLRNIPLTNGSYTARFYKQTTSTKNFTVKSHFRSTDQVVLGGSLLMAYKDNCSIKIGYEANIGSHYNVQEGNISLDWMF